MHYNKTIPTFDMFMLSPKPNSHMCKDKVINHNTCDNTTLTLTTKSLC